MNQQNGYQKEYEEIDLINYLKVILKRKWLALTIFLAVIITSALFSFFLPKVYKIDTSLELGKTRGGEIVEPHLQVVEKINSGIYGGPSKMKVSGPVNTNIIRIETFSEDLQKAVKDLENMNDLILAEHNNKINLEKDFLEKEIKKLQEKIDFFITKKQEAASLQLEINNFRRQIETLQPTKVIKEPTISKKPQRPKIFLNIVIAAILGLFLGAFTAFFKEWWDKNKTR